MSKEEDDFFLQNVRGVEPIKRKNHIRKKIKKIPKNIIEKKESNKQKTKEAETKKKKQQIFSLEFGRTNKKLKSGKITIDKKIDFHGATLAEAESIFKNSVIKNYNDKNRCLLFITGKGLNKKNYLDNDTEEHRPRLFYGRIRSAFLDWVKKPEFAKFILTIEKASIEHGGDGAFYVYLRKKSNQSRP